MAQEIITLAQIMQDTERHQVLIDNISRALETKIGANDSALLEDIFLAFRFSGYHLIIDDEIIPTNMR